MTDIQEKIKEAYIREGRTPDCLPESYREEIMTYLRSYNPYTRMVEETAEQIIAAINSGGIPHQQMIGALSGFGERDKTLIREAIDQFNSTSATRGFGLYVSFKTVYCGFSDTNDEYANIYVGPVVE